MNIHSDILEWVDVIASSTSDEATKLAVDKIRALHSDGVTPSNVLKQAVEEEEDKLKQEVIRLETLLAELNEQNWVEPVDGFYTMDQFLSVLFTKMRRSYGWRIDYIQASHDNPNCQPVENMTVQTWQNRNKVPQWAVEQIDRMPFRKRQGSPAPRWSEAEEDYLRQQYLFDPLRKNMFLAQCCESSFGRHIGENSIKGALDRLRKRGLLPKKRALSKIDKNVIDVEPETRQTG